VLKIKLPSERQLIGKFAVKHGVTVTGYPLSYWKDKKALYVVGAGFVFGEEKKKKAFLKDMIHHPDISDVEVNKDFMIAVIKQPLFTEPAYDPRIIRTKPTVINKNGLHIWELASFNRTLLEKVLKFAIKKLGATMLKFKEEKITNISFTQLLPRLTDKQKDAIEIAINSGYYEYPKRIKMEKLAKIMGIAYSTYQAHLKKAEGRLVPYIYEEL